MPRPVRPWFRFYTEAFSDRKIRRLKPEHRWLFAACLGAARQSPEAGVLLVAEGLPMDARDLADWAGIDVRTVKAGMRALIDLGLIVERSLGDHGEIAWSSPTFQDRQFESDDTTKRTRKYRATREYANEGTFQPSSRERSGNVGRNVPETETETETEKNSCASGDAPERFEEFWDTYDKKRDRKTAERKYKLALKKRGVTADLLISSARSYIAFQKRNGQHPQFTKDPATWLNNESWTNELTSHRNTTTNTRTEDYDPFEKFAALGRMQSQAAMREQRQ